MSTPVTPLTDAYTKLLDSVRSMIPGIAPDQPPVEKKVEVVAKQEWEGEGGAPKVVPPAKVKGAPKLLSRKVAAKPKLPVPKAKQAAPKAKQAAPKARSKPRKSTDKAGKKRARR